MIHIGRAGAKLGSFSEEEVRKGLVSGRFSLTDLGWKEGMENWAPLSQFPELTAPPEPVPPPLEEALAAEMALPAGLPWDARKEIGLPVAFAETARLVLTNPSQAFARMRAEGNLSGPLLYNLLGGWLGLIASGLYLVLTTRMQPAPANLSPMEAMFYVTPARAMKELELFAFAGPVLVTLGVMVCSAIVHLFLKLAGGANKPYHVTMRVFCFGYGSTQLLQLFPFCGSVLAPVWMLVCCVVGLATAHGTTTGRSAAAMVLFMAACFACCIGTLILAMGASSLHQALSQ